MQVKKIFLLIALIPVVTAGCKKHASRSPQSYVVNMAGAHSWHGTENYQCSSCDTPADTAYSIADSFTITVIDQSHIAIPFSPFTSCDTMFYAGANSTYNSISFTSGNTNPYTSGAVIYSPYYNATIIYYYLTNTFVYQSTTSNPGENWSITLYAP